MQSRQTLFVRYYFEEREWVWTVEQEAFLTWNLGTAARNTAKAVHIVICIIWTHSVTEMAAKSIGQRQFQPARQKRPDRVHTKIPSGTMLHVCMTSDFFLQEADGWREEVWDMIRCRRDVHFWIQTKRAERMADHLPEDWGDGWENVTLCVTTENQKCAEERLPLLLAVPAKHKAFMIAPILSEVHAEKYLATGQVEQVLCDGENYDGNRPCRYEWIRSLHDQCRNADIPFRFLGTGNYFCKDGKVYCIPKKHISVCRHSVPVCPIRQEIPTYPCSHVARTEKESTAATVAAGAESVIECSLCTENLSGNTEEHLMNEDKIMNVRAKIEPLLLQAQKPAQYIGGEVGSICKERESVDVRFAFCFPDTYEIGMSHLGMKILYSLINARENFWCERVFAPCADFEALMREHQIPLYALESLDPVREFDFVGFTLQYELSYTNILNMLDLAGIPLHACDRGEALAPLEVAGGPCVCNPEPLADFFDLFILGRARKSIWNSWTSICK